MKPRLIILILLFTIISLVSCKKNVTSSDMNIIFLHHSTGGVIWNGNTVTGISKFTRRISNKLADWIGTTAQLPLLFDKYNEENKKNYQIKEILFPKSMPYGWNNYPYDYYNIWVKNAGEVLFKEEPTLEILTKEYQVIIFKHCFPVSNIKADEDSADINSNSKTISNYKLQYTALRDKLHEFPNTKFILFTGAALVKSCVTEDEAQRAKEFFRWVVDEWDLPGDNIHLWDFYTLQTEGGLYFKDEYALSLKDSHPNEDFAGKVVKFLFNRIVDIIENDGNKTSITGNPR